jgi:V8-like Glu-specific endopeptidase
LLASALTIVALPAVWLVNRSDDAAASSTPATSLDPMGTVQPVYLHGTAAPVDAVGSVTPAVGTADGQVVATGTAIFRRTVTNDHICQYSGVKGGSRIVVVNLDNDRSMTCTTIPRPQGQPPRELVMSANAFAGIADPSSAPIDIQIRLRS